jgi:hypothetical protein
LSRFSVHAAAGPLAPSKPSQLVTAYGGTQDAAPCGAVAGRNRVDKIGNADGSSSALEIPAKSVLVVTHLEIAVLGATASSVDSILFAAIDPANPPTLGSLGANSSVAGLADAAGRLQASETIPDGLVVEPPALLASASRRPILTRKSR